MRQRGEDPKAALEDAARALGKVIDLSEQFEDDELPLWRGYAGFNYARVIRELNRIDEVTYKESDWEKAFTSADRHRSKWRSAPVFLPARLRDGLITELMHLRATRIDMTDLSVDLGARLTDSYDEFNEWLQGPSQNRVRLANNVIHTWQKIKKERKL